MGDYSRVSIEEESKIKVENEEHVAVIEDEIGKNPIYKEIGALVLLM